MQKKLLCISLILFSGWLMAFRRRKKKMLSEIIYSESLKYGLNDIQAQRVTDLLIAQAKHETGNFKSKSYSVGHNLFGMKRSSRDFDDGEYLGHATFKDDTDSIRDMLQYINNGKRYSLLDVSNLDVLQYVTYLKDRNYYEDTLTNYFNGVSGFYRGKKTL